MWDNLGLENEKRGSVCVREREKVRKKKKRESVCAWEREKK